MEKQKFTGLEIMLSIVVVVCCIAIAYQSFLLSKSPDESDFEKLKSENVKLKAENTRIKSKNTAAKIEVVSLGKQNASLVKQNEKYKTYVGQCVPMLKVLKTLSECVDCCFVTRDIIKMGDVFSAMLNSANEMLIENDVK